MFYNIFAFVSLNPRVKETSRAFPKGWNDPETPRSRRSIPKRWLATRQAWRVEIDSSVSASSNQNSQLDGVALPVDQCKYRVTSLGVKTPNCTL